MMEAQASEVATDDALRSFCVIGPTVNSSFGRTWKRTQEAATAHAEKIIKQSFDGSRTKVQKLFVVQLVEVVEVSGPPVTRRKASAEDVDADKEGD